MGYANIKDPKRSASAKKAAATRKAKEAERAAAPLPPKVQVEDVRTITVTFTLEGIEAALIEMARQQTGGGIPSDPIFQGVELNMTADRDGEDVTLNEATVTFKFKP